MQLSDDQRWLAALGRDGAVSVWNFTQPSTNPLILRAPVGAISRYHLTPDGRWLIAQSENSALALWSLADQSRTPLTLSGAGPAVESWAVSPDGHWLVTNGTDHQFRLWDLTATDPRTNPITLKNASEAYSLELDAPANLRFSSDGRWLLALVSEPQPKPVPVIWLWDLRRQPETPKPLTFELDAEADAVFSPDSRWLAASTVLGNVFIWDLQANDLAASQITLGDGQAMSTAFSPDGRWLAVGGSDKTTYLWETAHLTEAPRSLLGQNAAVNRLVFSPDSKWLATSGVLGGSGGLYMLPEHFEDPTVLLWDMEQSAPAPLTVRSPARSLTAEGFSPDTRWLITYNEDGLQLWQVKADELISKACDVAGRNLTSAEWQQYLSNQEYRKTCEQWP